MERSIFVTTRTQIHTYAHIHAHSINHQLGVEMAGGFGRANIFYYRHTNTYTRTHAHTHARVRAHTHKHTHTNTHTNTQTHKHTHTPTYILSGVDITDGGGRVNICYYGQLQHGF